MRRARTLLPTLAVLVVASFTFASARALTRSTSGEEPPSAIPLEQEPVWLTYRDDAYGFEFQYPESCELGATQDEDLPTIYVGNRIQLALLDAGGRSLPDYVEWLFRERAEDWNLEDRVATLIGGREAITVNYRIHGSNRFATATFLQKEEMIFAWAFGLGFVTLDDPCDTLAVAGPILDSFRIGE